MASASALESLVGHVIVFDLTSRFVILGTYRGTDGPYYIVENADVHDLYVIDAKRHGVNCNRQRVLVRCDGVVGISRLEDVIE
jgi:hypothetical protein